MEYQNAMLTSIRMRINTITQCLFPVNNSIHLTHIPYPSPFIGDKRLSLES